MVQVLKDIAPSVKEVSVMFNPRTSPYNAFFMKSIEMVAPSFGVFPTQASVHSEEDIQKAIAVLGTRGDGGLIVPSDGFTFDRAALIASLATNHRLPGIYAFDLFAENGGLVSYGIDGDEQIPTSVVTSVRQRIAAGMSEHVRMRLEAKLRLDTCPLDHPGEAGRGEWCSTL